uniref:prostaglandin reductase 1-like n=1 Tax=Styela clava TaxID=7725 RepID=UPI00193A351A|nr:prostaglandin reductase 1-like [Styela clava]
MSVSVPESTSLGLYGVAGGDTIFIRGAAGAVGNVAAQIGKIKGCTVVGSCGRDKKVEFCKNIGYDAVFIINYKIESESLDAAVKRYFEICLAKHYQLSNPPFSSTILRNMNAGGQVGVCGSISGYNETTPVLAPIVQPSIVTSELMLKGFHFRTYVNKHKEGKMKCYEKVTKGFENVPDAFIDMLRGGNVGKAVVRL